MGGRGASSGMKSKSIQSPIIDKRSGVNYNDFPSDQQSAILSWTINSRGIRSGNSDINKQYAQSLENYIDQNPKQDATETLYRGIVMDNKDVNQVLTQIMMGQAIDQKGLSSWSSEEKTSMGFAGIHGGVGVDKSTGRRSVIFVSNGMKAKNGRYLPTEKQDEHEMIVSSKTKFKVTSYKTDKNTGALYLYVSDL